MRKLKQGRKLNRTKDQRLALMKSISRALILNERIKTTEAKAKEASRFVEKHITRAKKGDIASRRLLAKYFSPTVVKKLVDELGSRYEKRNGGYTRIFKLGLRKGDGAKMVIIELVK